MTAKGTYEAESSGNSFICPKLTGSYWNYQVGVVDALVVDHALSLHSTSKSDLS